MNGEHRPCERWCPGTGDFAGGHWRHHSRFHSYKRYRNGTVAMIQFDRLCKDCQQKERNEKKNEDRPFAIIRGRAQAAAHKAGMSTDFFMVQMNYRALVRQLEAMMDPRGLCLGCGHPFVNERDIQIDHIEPPRHAQDFARLHAQNLRLFCQACNNKKGDKPFATWLDEQEEARLANLKEPQGPAQMDLFQLMGGECHAQ